MTKEEVTSDGGLLPDVSINIHDICLYEHFSGWKASWEFIFRVFTAPNKTSEFIFNFTMKSSLMFLDVFVMFLMR